MASPILEACMLATMLVSTDSTNGTGFLLGHMRTEDSGKVFLITNKHVVFPHPKFRIYPTRISLTYNVDGRNGSLESKTVDAPLIYPDGTQLWREHPNRDVDVLAIDVTWLVVKHEDLAARWFRSDNIPDSSALSNHLITVGDEICVIGYPATYPAVVSKLPVLREGVISTLFGMQYQDSIVDDGKMRQRTLPAFLFDGAAIPGSSGSPVVLKPQHEQYGPEGFSFLPTARWYLVGIVAETSYALVPVGRNQPITFSGLGLAFDAMTIRETIDLFFK